MTGSTRVHHPPVPFTSPRHMALGEGKEGWVVERLAQAQPCRQRPPSFSSIPWVVVERQERAWAKRSTRWRADTSMKVT